MLSGTWGSGAPWTYRIGWTLSQGSDITLTIANANGTVIRHRITNTAYPSGASKVNWYGWTDQHVRVSPGTYTATVTAGGSSQSVQLSVN